jgi:flagellar biosynthesis chaperone FliJ
VAVSKALRRLLRIRELEEEQCKLALEAGLRELRRVEDALTATAALDRRGRRLVETSARTGELRDRLAGLEESRTAGRIVEILEPMAASCEGDVARLQQEYLEKRIERRQAETLIRATEAEDAMEEGRRTQQTLDDWFRSRLHRRRARESLAGNDFLIVEDEPIE